MSIQTSIPVAGIWSSGQWFSALVVSGVGGRPDVMRLLEFPPASTAACDWPAGA
jgi:hypothetical protein